MTQFTLVSSLEASSTRNDVCSGWFCSSESDSDATAQNASRHMPGRVRVQMSELLEPLNHRGVTHTHTHTRMSLSRRDTHWQNGGL
eukprot:2068580-Rhodomonas_salina.3